MNSGERKLVVRNASVENDANARDDDWLVALEAELLEIKGVLETLAAGTQNQSALIEAEDATGIQALLEVRAGVLASIEKASERAAPLVETFERQCEEVQASRVEELRVTLDTIGRLLQAILDSDREAEASLGKAMSGIKERISQTRAASVATHAYHEQGAVAPEARFSDRKA